MAHYNADLDDLGHWMLQKGRQRTKSREQRQDRTLDNYAMLPPVKETRHARQRRQRRTNVLTAPVYAPGTHRSVVITHVPTCITHRLTVPPAKLVGKGGHRVKELERRTGAQLHVTQAGTVQVRGTKAQQKKAQDALKPYITAEKPKIEPVEHFSSRFRPKCTQLRPKRDIL